MGMYMHNRPVLEHVLLIILGALWQEEVTQNLRESIGVDEQRKVSTCGKRQRTNDTIEIDVPPIPGVEELYGRLGFGA
jgi:hypothetical protein